MPRFRILESIHIEADPEFPHDPLKERVYERGDVFDSPSDLVEKFNKGPFSRKFEQVDPSTPLANKYVGTPKTTKRLPPTIGAMTSGELKAYAEAEGIDLKGCKTAEDMRKAIQAWAVAGKN